MTLDWDLLLKKHRYSKLSDDCYLESSNSEETSEFEDSDDPDAGQQAFDRLELELKNNNNKREAKSKQGSY